jgi:hypothetical protein
MAWLEMEATIKALQKQVGALASVLQRALDAKDADGESNGLIHPLIVKDARAALAHPDVVQASELWVSRGELLETRADRDVLRSDITEAMRLLQSWADHGDAPLLARVAAAIRGGEEIVEQLQATTTERDALRQANAVEAENVGHIRRQMAGVTERTGRMIVALTAERNTAQRTIAALTAVLRETPDPMPESPEHDPEWPSRTSRRDALLADPATAASAEKWVPREEHDKYVAECARQLNRSDLRADKAEAEVETLRRALDAVYPYAETRVEDICEEHGSDPHPTGRPPEVAKATDALAQALPLLSPDHPARA